jgi:hypothetical protein
MALWDELVGPESSEQALTTYVISAMYNAACGRHFDKGILTWFFDYFGEWTAEEFRRLNQNVRTLLKNFIMRRGVYVDYGPRKSIPEALVELLHMERLPQWPEGTAEGQDFDPRSRIASMIASLTIGQQTPPTPQAEAIIPSIERQETYEHGVETLRRTSEGRISNNPL